MISLPLMVWLVSQAVTTPTAKTAGPEMHGKIIATMKNTKGEWKAAKDAVKPGDLIKYELLYSNEGTQPAMGFELRNAVPMGTRLAEKPTSKNCRLEFSVDNGKSYAERPQRLVNGKPVPIPVGEFTNLRCIQAPKFIAPGGSVSTEYIVVVQ